MFNKDYTKILKNKEIPVYTGMTTMRIIPDFSLRDNVIEVLSISRN